MAASSERLMELLPAVYGLRDSQEGHVLRAFLDAIQEQAEAIEADIDGLYDNWFIETCDEWVVPYVADLLGVRDLLQVTGGGISRRAFVANVLAYRRGKGTAVTLEQIARDLTGWPAKSVEFFARLIWAQHANHVRPEAHATISLTDATGLELVGDPFESAAHTVDVRHIDNNRGRYNLANVGIFLWRLGAYPIERSPAPMHAPGLYHFHQAGGDAPLFNAPVTEVALTQTTEEVNVPGPLRRRALNDDLAAFRSGSDGVPILDVSSNSDYYGPGRSIEVIRDGVPLSPLDIVAADLSAWDRPPGGVVVLRSGDLSSFPALSSGTPEVAVTIGAEGPRTATLSSVPASLPDAAAALQAALHAASPSTAFSGARVLTLGDRLVVLPGVRGAEIVVGATSSDASTAGELRLAAPDGGKVHVILTDDIEPFPELVASLPEVEVQIGSTTAVAALASTPTSVAGAATELQAAIQDADPSSAFTDTEVHVAGNRLVVIPGTADAIVIRPTAADSTTARQLGLRSFVAVDPYLGRLAFSIGDEPDEDVLVSYNYGFGADIGGGPYDRRATLVTADPLLWSRTVSQQDPGADFATLTDALTAWADPGDGNKADAVITVTDNGAYVESISVEPADGKSLVLQAADGVRPRVRFVDSGGELADLAIAAGGEDARLELDGLLIEGGVSVASAALGVLNIRHCTLVPGRAIDSGVAAFPTSASVIVEEPNDALKLEVAHSIIGPIHTPPDMQGLQISDSIVGTPTAPDAEALVSGSLATFPSLSSSAPRLQVTIGGEGPHEAVLAGVPGSLAEARDMLQPALRDAHRSDAFAEARVVSAGNRLIVLSAGGPISIGSAGSDPTAAELRLEDGTGSYGSHAFLSGPLDPFPAVTSATPKVAVIMGAEGPHDASFASVPTSLAQARDQLQDAIRDAGTSQGFDGCLVAAVDEVLVVVPGALTTVRFEPAEDDGTTIAELGLLGPGPALSGTSDGPGAATTLLSSTVLGTAHVRALTLASESIFSAPVIAQRRQIGCVRFSFVPPGSVVPRRFRCQPSDETTAGRVRPSFTSTTYGHPGFGQLTPSCPRAISAGAADEGEMGAFHMVQSTQRLANLLSNLDEYLRFGLEAGVFFAT